MIDLLDVSKTFVSLRGTTGALAGIHLSIPDGDFVCLVGPSGCGKTTLLHLVAGLDLPDSGQVLVDGAPVRAPGSDRVVLFQEAGLFPWLTVAHNIEFALALEGVPRSERRARALAWLRTVGVARFADAHPHELSGGMRQRVALARALAVEPRILLLDEPFAALDVHARAALHTELERLWLRTRKTILFVTHDVTEAVRLGERVVVLGRRPARVRFTLPVPLPRPRTLDDDQVVLLARLVRERIDPDWRDERLGPDERGQNA